MARNTFDVGESQHEVSEVRVPLPQKVQKPVLSKEEEQYLMDKILNAPLRDAVRRFFERPGLQNFGLRAGTIKKLKNFGITSALGFARISREDLEGVVVEADYDAISRILHSNKTWIGMFVFEPAARTKC